ncbi:hypothetical protein IZU89_00355 [Cellulophaga lytica]|uniref:DUF4149 domain-containing protein n=1 Tax=Cellulophaga geojensis KL-A TaxID=1328323 RepID=A0ABP3B591_9FLAO|nr:MULTISPECIES: hypothetical protein [Cellulophaga]APU08793.1 hypothetical protein A5M85_00355 [Cellulophaga lytica]EWH10007.1 hypothetical protein KLA_17032 [Cellulophaga geojensis KL-A]
MLTIILLINIPNSVFLAKRELIGRQERIEKISKVNIKGAKGEDLYLAHKTSALFLFFNYIIGYSLWIFLVFIIVTQVLKYRFKKQANSK